MIRKQDLKKYQNLVTIIRTDGKEYSCQQAEQIRIRNNKAENPFVYVLWGNEGIHLLENRDLGRFAETEIYVIEGSSNLLFSSTVILDGTIERSCLISPDIAQDLFGVSDATGMMVTLENQKYCILGMLPEVKGGAVFCSKDRKTSVLDRINVHLTSDDTLSYLVQRMKWEFGFKGRVVEYRILNNGVEILSVIIWFLLWVFLLRLLVIKLKQYNKKIYRTNRDECKNRDRIDFVFLGESLIYIGCICGVVLLLVIYIYFRVKIPDDIIPSKWSDFDFWNRLFVQKKECILTWIKCEKFASELFYIKKSLQSVFWFLVANVSCFFIRIRISHCL